MLGRTQGSENLGTRLQAVPRQLCVLSNNRTFWAAAKKYSSRSLFASQKLCCMPSMAKGEQLNRWPVAKKIDYFVGIRNPPTSTSYVGNGYSPIALLFVKQVSMLLIRSLIRLLWEEQGWNNFYTVTDADIVTSLDNGQTKSVNLGILLPMLLLAPMSQQKCVLGWKKLILLPCVKNTF